MQAKKFELMLCCLGNGVTCCNKAVEVNGDYKIVAHISNEGNIRLYVNESYIPAQDMEKIRAHAKAAKENFLYKWSKLTDFQKIDKLLDFRPKYIYKTGASDIITVLEDEFLNTYH